MSHPKPQPRALLLDSLGTLVWMEPPGPHLREQLARIGYEVDEERAARAFGAEIAYYLDNHLEGRDEESLAALRERCAAVLAAALGLPELTPDQAREALLGSIRFRAYPDAAPALEDLRDRGVRLVVASNWDCSLPRVLDDAGLGEVVDGVVSSAEAGAAKPDARLFQTALAVAECAPGEALHVGDSPEKDVAGAEAAGIRAVLLARDGAPAGVPHIASLAELAAVL